MKSEYDHETLVDKDLKGDSHDVFEDTATNFTWGNRKYNDNPKGNAGFS